jgi:hypothetical protein
MECHVVIDLFDSEITVRGFVEEIDARASGVVEVEDVQAQSAAGGRNGRFRGIKVVMLTFRGASLLALANGLVRFNLVGRYFGASLAPPIGDNPPVLIADTDLLWGAQPVLGRFWCIAFG